MGLYILLRLGSAVAELRPRSVGSLTGSRAASALGRAPVEEALAALADQLTMFGFLSGPPPPNAPKESITNPTNPQ